MEIIGWPAGRAEQINTASHTYCVHVNRPLQVAGCLKRNTTCLVVAILEPATERRRVAREEG